MSALKARRVGSVPPSAIGLTVVSMVSLEAGTALAQTLFAAAGVVFVTFLRNAYSAAILLPVTRPKLRSYSLGQWREACLLGVVMAAMNLTLYAAVARLPLGVAVAIAFLGPITLAVVSTRRNPRQWVWSALGYGGVFLFTPVFVPNLLDFSGVLIAVVNAACWGLYIVFTGRVGARFASLDGLALATSISCVVLLPVVLSIGAAGFSQPRTLAIGFAMAAAASAVPYACDYTVLRWGLPSATYSILLSLEPAIAALVGLLMLGQRLTWIELIAVTMVVCASVGATATIPSGKHTSDHI